MINIPSDGVMNRILSRAAQMKGGVKGGLKANSDAPAIVDEATQQMADNLLPEMTMEQAMLTPVTPEKAFNSPLDSTRNGPRATTFNAPRPSTFNGPRASTMNEPLMPEPVEFMEPAPLPELRQPAAPQPFVPPMVNGQEDWGSQVYNPDGGMRSIADLRQLPPRVQGELVRQNPMLQSYFPQTPRLEPAQATGTPEDMATMARYQGGLDAIPARPALEPSPMGKTYVDGPGGFQEAQGFAPRIPGMPTPPGLADPMQYDQGFTIDMGGSKDTFLGTREKPLSSEARRAKLEQDLADAIDTNDPAKAQMLQGALGALNGGAGGGGLSFEQKKQLQDDKLAMQKYLSGETTNRANNANKVQEAKIAAGKSAADFKNSVATKKITLAEAGEILDQKKALISMTENMLANMPRGATPSDRQKLNNQLLKYRNDIEGMQTTMMQALIDGDAEQGGGNDGEVGGADVGGNAMPKLNVPPGAGGSQQGRETEDQAASRIEREIKAKNPNISLDDLADRVLDELDKLGYQH